jgi:hypothetical protein
MYATMSTGMKLSELSELACADGNERKGPTLGCREVDDVAVALEHVDLLDSLDGLDVELLKSGLELLVVGASVPLDLLDLPAGGALASVVTN